jgi:spore germination protein
MFIHIVEEGETLYSIANQYDISLAHLKSLNGIGEENRIVVGQAILVILPIRAHIVEEGDTLEGISREYGVSVTELLANNPRLLDRNYLQVGELITIEVNNEKLGEIEVDGFVYPNVNENILKRALPYLTRLIIFGYGFNDNGDLIPTVDDKLIRQAYEYQVQPIMLLSNITDSGGFASDHAQNILFDQNAQRNLTNNLLRTLKAKGYGGVNLDFEYIPTSMKRYYSEFVKNLTETLNAEGFTVDVDVAPKTKANQTGLLFEAHDYEALGRDSNGVFLMTYEWGYSRSEPRAVAPIDEVEEVLQYAVSEMPADKIIFGIPNYGYNWQLPYVKGTTVAKSVGNQEAQNLAAEFWSQIQYDELAQTPFFDYRNNQLHEVWFEDTRSIYAKLMLAYKYGISRIGYWNIMRAFPQNYALLNYFFDIKKII